MKRYLVPLFFPGMLILASGCEKSDPEQHSDSVKHVTLLYAVNRSSLAQDFKDDVAEMEAALTQIQSKDGRFLVYCTNSDGESASLYEASKDKSGNYVVKSKAHKTYQRTMPSTAPERISMVMEDALKLYPQAEYSLIFWGHGSSWTPEFSDHTVVSPQDQEDSTPVKRAYGGEFTGNMGDWSNIDWADLKELADAIPDGKFRYIWFDCCYMSGIETIYQLRNKCETYVAYPTEVWQYGLPYDLVLPYIFRESPDLKGGAEVFFNYYNDNRDPVTATVIDMSKVEAVAQASANILALGESISDKGSLLNYSRDYRNPYYDFRQIMTKMIWQADRADLAAQFNEAFGNMVIYSAGSDRNFNRVNWDVTNLSGVSAEYFDGSKSEPVADYYKTLDWYKRVY